ncbi:MAG: transporter substrate-binding domain-containing protein [Gammaproteobacteria bacterium]|nr:transporter substrate-binding domain-containing protein [Gammaproteobacteria bacterium]
MPTKIPHRRPGPWSRCAATLVLLAASAMATAAHAATLVVGTKESPPFAMVDERTGEWSGISIDLWERIALELGYRTEYRSLPLDELLDSVAAGEIDVALAALTVTANREREADFTHPYYQSNLAIAVPAVQQTQLGAVVAALLSPAFLSALGILLVLLAGVGLLVWLAERRSNAEEFGGTPIEGLGSGFWWSAVTMTTVGYGDKSPRTLAGRLLALVWMFTSLIIVAGITGAMASAFTVTSLRTSITGPADLPGLRVGTVTGSTSEDYLNGIGARPLAEGRLETALEDLAANRLDAVVYDAPVLDYLIQQRHAGELQILPAEFNKESYAIALTEDTERLEPINLALLEITASADWQAIRRRYLGDGP